MGFPRHEMSRRLSPSFLLGFVALLCTALGLGGVRLYSLYLEHRLSEVSLRIEKTLDRNAELERKLSSLLSPQRVYSVARVQLGMLPPQKMTRLSVVLVPKEGRSQLATGSSRSPNRRESLMEKSLRLFVNQATAQD